jgi:hypothetical protein
MRCSHSPMRFRHYLLCASVFFTPACNRRVACGDSISAPDCAAWSIFAEISQSANNGTRDLQWESWISADRVFADPKRPPSWPGQAHSEKRLARSLELEMFAPPGDNPLANEVRMNRVAFDFIVGRGLWNNQGLAEAFKGPPIDFPVESIEIKARWVDINEGQKPDYHWQYVQGDDHQPRLMGLDALHMTSRVLPNWLWATWKHKWASDRTRDHFGFPRGDTMSSGLKEMFARNNVPKEVGNYRLIGTQVEFSKPDGTPTLLGNSKIEFGFEEESSCITCHALARFDSSGCVHTKDEQCAANCGSSCSGPPPVACFTKMRQLHFVWSFLGIKCSP